MECNDLQAVVERVIPGMHFALITPRNNAVIETAYQLWAALVYRKCYECKVYASTDVAFLCRLVGQQYVPFYYENVTNEGDVPRLGVPTDCSSYFALHDNSQIVNSVDGRVNSNLALQPAITPNTCDIGFWAVTGVNGFHVAGNISDAIGLLIRDVLISPMAIWCESFPVSMRKARENYAKRFYQRYDFRYEQIGYIPIGASSYIDEAYSQRELRWKNSRNTLFELYAQGF